MRRSSRIALLLASLLTIASGASAQRADVIERLMGEPLSLFDWGLAQLDRDMERAARRMFPHQAGPQMPRVGSIYNWRQRRVMLYLSLTTPRDTRTQKACRKLFERTVNELTAGAPAGRDAAGWYLLNAFKPKAHFWGGRFEDIGAQLAERVRLQIALIPASFEAAAGDNHRVTCTARLDANPADLVFDTGS